MESIKHFLNFAQIILLLHSIIVSYLFRSTVTPIYLAPKTLYAIGK